MGNNLTRISIVGRKVVRYFIFFLIFLIIGRVLFKAGVSLYQKFFPPPPTPPQVLFSKLPSLYFPAKDKINLTFILETPEAGLPTFSDQAYVYFMPKLSSNLLSLDYAKQKFANLGYDPNPQQISDTTYKFFHQRAPSILETDIITGSFSLDYDLLADPSPLSTKPLSAELAVAAVKDFLSNASILPSDLTGPTTHVYLKQEGDQAVAAISLSDAILTRVDLFRKSYEDLPVVTAKPTDANIWFIVSGSRENGKTIIAGEYHYFPVDETQKSTYPIKSADLAWQEFQSGNYYLASQGSAKDGQSLKIRRMYLAYYDPGKYQEFFQPIFVFEGDEGFVGYVPAITLDYYGE